MSFSFKVLAAAERRKCCVMVLFSVPYVPNIVPCGIAYNTLSIVYVTLFIVRNTMDNSDWEKQVANLLKSQLKLRGVTYKQLVEKLAEIGVEEKEANIKNKLSRGKFSSVFLIQCLKAIGSDTLRLE